ncbi:hypothetical protein L9G74_04525 [Shewanella sp. C32]|uniref:Lipoprotein n=1 Tax=Shewanella electrica TaxID=515560 RepID=A0ABT2FH95_9GAMM|nr:hypothetical protein [Shewanella electrica]MCH1923597.1 hypothetical protein [Shewanella electrica]MCS4555693.1 hypothetical protein [Shewanella electrica]
MLTRYALVSSGILLLSACEPAVPSDSAMSCFNPDLYQDGNQYLTAIFAEGKPTSFALTRLMKDDSQSQPTGKRSITTQVSPDVRLLSSSQRITIDAANYRYLQQSDEYQFRAYSVKQDYSAAPQPTDFNFDTPNQSRNYNISFTSERIRGNDVTTTAQQHQETITFVGIEPLTTPAGAFTTCRMHTQGVNADGSKASSMTTWYAQQLGIPLQSEITSSRGETQKTVVIQATINGKTYTATPTGIDKQLLAEALAFAKSQG